MALHPHRILITGTNRTLSATPFSDAALNDCRCPDCHGTIRPDASHLQPERKPFQRDCRICGGAGLNRHREAA